MVYIKRHVFALVLTVPILLAACSKEAQKDGIPAQLTFIKQEMSIPAQSGDVTSLYILNHGNGLSVSAQADVDWITDLDASVAGQLTMKVSANEGSEARTATITIEAGDAKAAQKLIQAAGSSSEDTPKADINFSATTVTGFYLGSGKMDMETGKKGEVGNFKLVLSDKALKEDGSYDKEGTYYSLDLYSSTPFDPREASLDAVTYTAQKAPTPWKSGIIGTSNSLVTVMGSSDIPEQVLNVETGSMEVTVSNDGVYNFKLEIVTNDGGRHHVSASARVEFVNQSSDFYPLHPIQNNISTEFVSGDIIHYESVTDEWSNFLVYFSDMPRDASGQYTPPGNMITLNLWGKPVGKHDRNMQSATYNVTTNQGGTSNCYLAGYNFMLPDGINVIPGGSYVTSATADASLSYGLLEGGTVTIMHKEDGTYNATIDVIMGGGYHFKGTYSGTMGLTDNDPYEDPDPVEVTSTFTEDIDCDFISGQTYVRARYLGAYYQTSRKVTADWIIQLLPSENAIDQKDLISIELIDKYHEYSYYNGGLPTGTWSFDMENSTIYAPDTFVPGYLLDGSLSGTYYARYTDLTSRNIKDYGPMLSGSISIAKNSNNTYTFTWDLFDDNVTPYHITGSYTGPVDYIEDVSEDEGKEDVY